MKKILLGIGFALVTGMASAQSVGVKAGLNYTTFQGDDAGQYDYRPGYTVGVTARKGINDLIGLQTELLYTSKGAKREFSTGSVNSEERLRLNYLDIPVLLSVQAGGLYFELGPQVSFLLKGKQILEVTNASGNTTTTTELDITDNPYPVDLGYAAGLGYRAGSGLGIGLRYNGGLKNIDDEGLFEGRERRNTSFQLTLSYTTGF